MMRAGSNLITVWGLVAGILLIFGCTPLSKVGEAKVDMTALAGKWEGEYSSAATRRSGKVSLDLTSTADRATGGILMHPSASEHPSMVPPGKTTYAQERRPKVIPLSIDFVEAGGGQIKGDVTPYEDPLFNNETMHTTFEGTVTGNRMQGTFTVKVGDSGDSYTGTWWATRD